MNMSKVRTHKVTMKSGYEWLLRGDFTQSASFLTACFDPHEDDLTWQETPSIRQLRGGSGWLLTPLIAAKRVYRYFDAKNYTIAELEAWRRRIDDDEVNEVNEVNEEL
tara:strand:+ start:211 stop:534 length:324 start_codon:yes stop_codon:yes gene_type:complete